MLGLGKDPVKDDFGISEHDEGWWASILSDEGALISEKKELNCKPCQESANTPIDWECVKTLYSRDEIVLLEVYGFNRGGLLVRGPGIQGFVPISHLIELPVDASEETRQEILSNYEGRSIYLKVIECEPESDRVVLSERAAQAGEGKRKQIFESLEPGVIVCGVITNVTDFGIFVDLGGVEGLVHVSELSWGRVERPADLFKVGQPVKVMVLQVNESTSRIALSIKRLSTNPWDTIKNDYQMGDIVTATVTSIMRFGVFARLDEGIEGLIHISSISNLTGKHDLTEEFFPGQNVNVKILHVDAERRRLGLGLIIEE